MSRRRQGSEDSTRLEGSYLCCLYFMTILGLMCIAGAILFVTIFKSVKMSMGICIGMLGVGVICLVVPFMEFMKLWCPCCANKEPATSRTSAKEEVVTPSQHRSSFNNQSHARTSQVTDLTSLQKTGRPMKPRSLGSYDEQFTNEWTPAHQGYRPSSSLAYGIGLQRTPSQVGAQRPWSYLSPSPESPQGSSGYTLPQNYDVPFTIPRPSVDMPPSSYMTELKY